MPDEPFAVVAVVVSIHGNPVVFVSVVFRPDHRMELALPLGAAEYAATCSASPPSTRPFNGATLLSTGWGSGGQDDRNSLPSRMLGTYLVCA
jgi:hypothetical protein